MPIAILLEVRKRTIEDELNTIAAAGEVDPTVALYLAGAKQALEWLLRGEQHPAFILDTPLTPLRLQ